MARTLSVDRVSRTALGRRLALRLSGSRIAPFPTAKAPIDLVDLFCGCGGFSTGFSLLSQQRATYRFAGAVDIDADAGGTFQTNLSVAPIRQDVSSLVAGGRTWRDFESALDRRRGNRLVVVGGPPCQGFSSHRTTIAGCDELNSLVPAFATAAVRLGADAVVMENVPELLTERSWPYYSAAVSELTRHGYVVRTRIYNFATFGLPQERFRVLTIAMRKAFAMPVGFLARHRFRTVRDAIGLLPPLEPGLPHALDADHVTAKHRESTVTTIAAVPKDGGRRPLHLGPDCLRRLAQRNGRTGYDDVYGRLWWDRPSVTITGHSRNPASGRFCHPLENRGLSVREAALLQGFPKRFRFCGSFDSRFMQVGNAVSPAVSAYLAGHVADQVLNEADSEDDHALDVVKPVGTSFSRLIPGIKSGALKLCQS
jgi:DNA (cytosine-5)-methyltransferase 1